MIPATLDGISIKCRAAADDLFLIDYGNMLYPGRHNIRFSFKNNRNQSSMIYTIGLTIEIKKGDCERLVADGIKLLKNKTKPKEGLKMLLSALSMGPADPDADKIIWNIAKGFESIGERENSEYFYARLYNFYPQSKYAKTLANRFKGYRFPVVYSGKQVDLIYEPSLKDESKK